MRPQGWTAGALALALAMMASGATFASDDPDALFRAGLDAFERGAFDESAAAFEQADALVPHAVTRLNAARARQAAGDDAIAADGYEAALRMTGLSKEETAFARERLQALDRSLGVLAVGEPVGGFVTVGHAKRREIPTRIHVPPGQHAVRTERPDGSTQVARITVRAGAVVELVVPLPTPDPPAAPPSRESGAEGIAATTVTGIAALSTGLIAAGFGIGLGIAGLDARDDYEASQRLDLDARNTAVSMRTAANVAWTSAAVLIPTGVVLTWAPWTGDSTDGSIRPSGVALLGRFD